MRKWIDILTEAPLADISVHGDLDQEGSFDKRDRHYMKAAIQHRVYHEKLRKVPFPLYVYILNQTGLEELSIRDTIMGVVNWANSTVEVPSYGTYPVPLEGMRDAVAANVAKDPSAVHLIMGNNYSIGGAQPPTPWIVVHRLLHTIDYGFFNLFDIQTKEPVGYRTEKRISWWDVAMMKSVRNGGEEFDNEPELFLEMAAEYLITGNIRVNTALVTEKCERLGKDPKKIFRAIDRFLAAYKLKIDAEVATMSGTTRYI